MALRIKGSASAGRPRDAGDAPVSFSADDDNWHDYLLLRWEGPNRRQWTYSSPMTMNSQSHIVARVLLHSTAYFALVHLATASTSQASLTAEPEEIASGQVVILRWTVPAGSKAFLPPVGEITGPSSGEIQVRPLITSDFLLIVDSGERKKGMRDEPRLVKKDRVQTHISIH
jgi:hypothetical protein